MTSRSRWQWWGTKSRSLPYMSCRPSGRDSTTCSTITCDKEFHFLKKHLKVETTLCREKSPETLGHRPRAARLPPRSARRQVRSRRTRGWLPGGARAGDRGGAQRLPLPASRRPPPLRHRSDGEAWAVDGGGRRVSRRHFWGEAESGRVATRACTQVKRNCGRGLRIPETPNV